MIQNIISHLVAEGSDMALTDISTGHCSAGADHDPRPHSLIITSPSQAEEGTWNRNVLLLTTFTRDLMTNSFEK